MRPIRHVAQHRHRRPEQGRSRNVCNQPAWIRMHCKHRQAPDAPGWHSCRRHFGGSAMATPWEMASRSKPSSRRRQGQTGRAHLMTAQELDLNIAFNRIGGTDENVAPLSSARILRATQSLPRRIRPHHPAWHAGNWVGQSFVAVDEKHSFGWEASPWSLPLGHSRRSPKNSRCSRPILVIHSKSGTSFGVNGVSSPG